MGIDFAPFFLYPLTEIPHTGPDDGTTLCRTPSPSNQSHHEKVHCVLTGSFGSASFTSRRRLRILRSLGLQPGPRNGSDERHRLAGPPNRLPRTVHACGEILHRNAPRSGRRRQGNRAESQVLSRVKGDRGRRGDHLGPQRTGSFPRILLLRSGTTQTGARHRHLHRLPV
ncbi:MAG: hypothetical protein BWY82_00321 [Verrucomicrobia bacterium ADurb.Bin474]|nr:MAG: hypothetical protein BWY82_00321 [Verrucomicrobia bacterium ADurb.Bin474]